VTALVATDRNNGRLARCYGTSTTTLKNLKPDFWELCAEAQGGRGAEGCRGGPET